MTDNDAGVSRAGYEDLVLLLKQFTSRFPEVALEVDLGYTRSQGFERDIDGYLIKVFEEMGELSQAFLQHTGRRQSDGLDRQAISANVNRQASDVLMFFLMFCTAGSIDLYGGLSSKWFPHIEALMSTSQS